MKVSEIFTCQFVHIEAIGNRTFVHRYDEVPRIVHILYSFLRMLSLPEDRL